MKPKYICSFVFAVVVISAIGLSVHAKDKDKGLVAHEWGTFTSLQGGDGALIPWKPLQTSQLPKFVYDWSKPNLGLRPTSMYLFANKGAIISLQRMETPVIYFYSDQKETVDVSVKFPKGFITEWYPVASQIGPSALLTNGIFAPFAREQSSNSLIRWSGLEIMPAADFASLQSSKLHASLPTDASGSHYFAARETDADYVAPQMSKIHGAQYEKFLFYRGVGSFETPLRLTMKSDDSVVLANTGKEPLSHLFVLGVKDKSGNFVYVPQLQPGEEKVVPINPQMIDEPQLSKNLGESMANALVKAGLYQREATAMVNTWKGSWFAEDGTRVLYILPRAWTDETLPMDLKPAPRELVRVMVGRAEILTPNLERSLVDDFDKAKHGDTAASAEARKTLHSLGRFAEPAFYRALAHAKPQFDEQKKLMALLTEPRQVN
jgi:hypothetical protein